MSDFKPSLDLHEAIKKQPRDMFDIIFEIMNYLDADPRFETTDFVDAIKYTLSHGLTKEELYSPFDSEYEFNEDESMWDNDYYIRSRVYLKENFCPKRISHVMAIAKKLYPPQPKVEKERESGDARPKEKARESEFPKAVPIIATLAAVVAIVVIIILNV